MDEPLQGHSPGPNFSGNNYHHQNGLEERRIISLQDLECCQMIYSRHWCPSTIATNLWYYVIRHAAAIINENPFRRLNYISTHMQIFSKSKVDSNPSRWKPFF